MINLFKSKELEERFFLIVLLCSIPYHLINIVIILLYGRNDEPLVIYAVLLTITLGILVVVIKRKSSTLTINIFSFLLIAAYLYYLPSSAGPTGGIGYVLVNLIIVSILLTKGLMRYFVTIVLSGIALVLFNELISFSGVINYGQLLIDFIINLIFVTVFMLFFKLNFDAERSQLEEKNEQLEKLNNELSAQTDELQKTNDEIQAIRDNLQEKVIERTEKLEKENKRLLEYSFINAHLVRAPIANIIGVTELNENDPKLEEVRKGILEMDEVVRKIAEVLEK